MKQHAPSDDDTTMGALRQMVRDFVDQRDWRQFHAPKNISMALSVEAAELMEHFQWMTVAESRAVGDDPARLGLVGEELADVMCYAMALANELDIDIASTMRAKMKKNEAKYPAEEYQGRYE